MNKTIFTGTVNGQTFDNVNDYNTAIQAVLDKGENLQASSNTRVVDVPEDDPGVEPEKGVGTMTPTNRPLKPCAEFLPGFGDSKHHYIDSILTKDDEVYDEKMEELDNNLQEVYNRLVEAVPHNTSEQMTTYATAVSDIQSRLQKDYDKTTKSQESILNKINQLERELDDLYDKSNLLDKSIDIIQTYQEFYDEVMKVFELPKCDCDRCCEEDCKCTCHEVEPQQEVKMDRNSVKNFLNWIFGE